MLKNGIVFNDIYHRDFEIILQTKVHLHVKTLRKNLKKIRRRNDNEKTSRRHIFLFVR